MIAFEMINMENYGGKYVSKCSSRRESRGENRCEMMAEKVKVAIEKNTPLMIANAACV